MIKVGSVAPNFNLMDHNRRLVSLESFLGTKNVILSFFVFAFTDNWTSQISEFREYKSKFTKRNTQVLGISCDPRPALAAYNLSLGPFSGYPVKLLSDFYPHGSVSKSYGLFNEESGTSFRAVVIVGKDGKVKFASKYTSVRGSGPTGQGVTDSDLSVPEILELIDNIDKTN